MIFRIILLFSRSLCSRQGSMAVVKLFTHVLRIGLLRQYFLKTSSNSPLGLALSISAFNSVMLISDLRHFSISAWAFLAFGNASGPPFFLHFCSKRFLASSNLDAEVFKVFKLMISGRFMTPDAF